MNKQFTDSEIRNRISLVVTKSTSAITGKRISDQVGSFDPNKFIEVIWDMRSVYGLNSPTAIIKTIAEAYCNYAQLDKNKPFLFKETSQSIYLQKYIEDNMNITMVQIIRDPRDNYAAIKDGVQHHYKNIGEGELESLASVLNRAKLDLEIAKCEVITKRPEFHVVKFEDLVSRTELVMRPLLQKLNIKWSETVLEPTLIGEKFAGNNHLGKKFDGVSADNLGQWRNRITRAEACLIEGWMSDIMNYWGYHPEFQKSEQLRSVADFYAWYNCKYFYNDSFTA